MSTAEVDLHPLFTGKITLKEIKQLAQLGVAPPEPKSSVPTNYFRDHRFPFPEKVKGILQELFAEPSYLPKVLIELVVDGYFDDGKVENVCEPCSLFDMTRSFVRGLKIPGQLPGQAEEERIPHGLTTIDRLIEGESFYIFGQKWYSCNFTEWGPSFIFATSSSSYYECAYNRNDSKLRIWWHESVEPVNSSDKLNVTAIVLPLQLTSTSTLALTQTSVSTVVPSTPNSANSRGVTSSCGGGCVIS